VISSVKAIDRRRTTSDGSDSKYLSPRVPHPDRDTHQSPSDRRQSASMPEASRWVRRLWCVGAVQPCAVTNVVGRNTLVQVVSRLAPSALTQPTV